MSEIREVTYKLRLVEHEDNARILEAFKRRSAGGPAGAGPRDAAAAQRARQQEERDAAKHDQRVFQNRMRILDRIAKEERKKREDSARDQKRLLDQAERQHEAATGRMAAGNAAIVDSLSAAAPTLLQFGRGLATLGLTGEQSTEKLLRGLVKVQAAFDIAVGAVQTFRNIQKAMEAARVVSEAAGAAETAQRTRNLALANAQIVAENRLAQARASTASAGVGGNLASLGTAAGAGGGFLSRGLATAGRAGPVGLAGAAALAGIAGAGQTIYETAAGRANAPGSLTGRINSLYVGAAQLFGLGRSARRRLAGAEARIAGRRAASGVAADEQQRQVDAQLRSLFLRQQQQQADDFRFSSAFGGAGNDQRLDLIQNRGGRLGQQLFGLTRGNFQGDAQSSALDQALSINQRLIDLTKQRLDVEKSIRDERRRTAQESIRAAQSELQLVKDKIARERDSLLSAAERFGQLNAFQQAQLVAIKTRADAGGKLNRAERAALRGVGTQDAVDIARRGDLAAAQQGGFFGVFGGAERRNVQQLAQRAQQLQVTVRDQRELIVQIDREEDKIAQQAAAAIARQLVIRDEILSRKIRLEVQAQARQQEEARQQAAAARRGVIQGGQ